MFIYLPPSKRQHNNNNREVKLTMLNSTDDDDDNRKPPPILYYQQPSQAKTMLDEAQAYSNPLVNQANNCWRTGHTVLARNPSGVTYDNEGTERLILYNDKAIAIPPPRMLEGFHQRCGFAG